MLKLSTVFALTVLLLCYNELVLTKSLPIQDLSASLEQDDPTNSSIGIPTTTPPDDTETLGPSTSTSSSMSISTTTAENEHTTGSTTDESSTAVYNNKQNDVPSMKLEGNFTIQIFPQLLTNAEIDVVARRAAAQLTRPAFKHFKEIFAQFAPDSWMEALNDIPLSTMRCVTRVGTKIGLLQQQHFLRAKYNITDDDEEENNDDNESDQNDQPKKGPTENDDDVISDGSDRSSSATPTEAPTTTPTNGNDDELNNADVDSIQTREQMMAVLRAMCSRGFAQIAALNEAMNETVRALPADVRKMLEEYSVRFNSVTSLMDAGQMGALKPMIIEFLEKLKTITKEDREKVGNLFPKIRGVITDSRIDQLLDMAINCTNGTKKACKSAVKMAEQIWTNGTAQASTAGLNAIVSNPQKSMAMFGQKDFMRLRDKREEKQEQTEEDPKLELPNMETPPETD